MELQVLVLGGGVGGPAEVVLVRLQLSVHGLQQHLVGGLAGDEAGLVHQGHDASVRLVDQAADDLRRGIFYNWMAFAMISSKIISREYLCFVAVVAPGVDIVVLAAVVDIIVFAALVNIILVAAVDLVLLLLLLLQQLLLLPLLLKSLTSLLK